MESNGTTIVKFSSSEFIICQPLFGISIEKLHKLVIIQGITIKYHTDNVLYFVYLKVRVDLLFS